MKKIIWGLLLTASLTATVVFSQSFPANADTPASCSEPFDQTGSLAPSVDENSMPPLSNADSFPAHLADEASSDLIFSPSVNSENWSGYSVNGPSIPYRAVSARFVVPSLRASSSSLCASAAYAGWIGLGGRATGKLAQIGISSMPGSTQTNIFEMVCSGSSGCFDVLTNFSNMKYKTGDQLEFTLIFSPTPTLGARSGIFTTTVTNISGGEAPGPFTSSLSLPNATDFYDGSSADWIDEAPSNANGTVYPLADFGHTLWSSARVLDEPSRTWRSLASENETRIFMVDYITAYVMASPDPLSSLASFVDVFLSCR